MSNYHCTCSELGYKDGMSYDELKALLKEKGTCTSNLGTFSPSWICSTVDRMFVQARKERDRKEMYDKRKARARV